MEDAMWHIARNVVAAGLELVAAVLIVSFVIVLWMAIAGT
jgi:flagellar biosynthesis protein FliQ